MDHLPPELVHQICAKLKSEADIKTFRLLNSRCAAIGAKYLLPVLHLTYLLESLEKLKDVSTHPDFRQHVHVLFFEPSLLCKYSTFDNYRKAARIERYGEGASKGTRVRELSETKLQEGWNLYQNVFEDHMRVYRSVQGPGVFKSALQQFPNLRAIRIQTDSWITDRWTTLDQAGMSPAKHFRKYLVIPKLALLRQEQNFVACSLLQDAAALDIKLEELYIGHTN